MRFQALSVMSLGFQVIFLHQITFSLYFPCPDAIPANKCHILWCRSSSLRMYLPYFFRLHPYPSHIYHFRPLFQLGQVMMP